MGGSFFLIMLVSFALTALFGLLLLPWLKRLKARQTERVDGPKSHLKKTGTPTMGGIMFLASFGGVSAFLIPRYRAIIPILIATLGFGLVGFIDDYIKVVMKRSMGLRAYQKLILEIIVSVGFLFYISHFTEISFDMMVPFSALWSADGADAYLHLGVFSVPFLVIVILGTVNGSNFTDGLDGLLGSVTLVITCFIAVASSKIGLQITPAAAAMAGSLFGFLIYNWNPAKVFMGDTGSLALGGFVVSSMIMMKMPLYIIFVGFIYLAEVISVIIQVLYFKITKGKRFFRMAPIHHHFELGGWSEIRVVWTFVAVTAVMCLITRGLM
ncbi:MAG: phospho-N-acetylmuramoyl-pentapeptide-transferase [Lachnospiraceae bacterium]|nr:phospho-N-acetylmuramoyl-pentapeptide-transferase [Lachnospiraceae bacterium]